MARCSVGSEENSNTARGIIIANVDLIREELGVTVLLVHHTGKDESKGERGGTALRGAMDTVLELKGGGTKTSVSLEMTKQKDDEEADTIHLKFNSVDIGEGKSSIVPYIIGTSSHSPVNDNFTEKERFMLDVIREKGGVDVHEDDVRESCKETEWYEKRSSSFSDTKKSLERKGVIIVEGKMISLSDLSLLDESDGEDEQIEQAL